MELGQKLKMLRMEKGLTMDMFVWDINTKYGIDLNKGLVSKWENGVNDPSLRYASILCQYYDISLDYLIGLTDVRTPSRLLAFASKKQPEDPIIRVSPYKPAPNRPQKSQTRAKYSINNDDDFEFEFLNTDN